MGCFETAGARPEVKPHATFYSPSTEERLAASGVGFSVAVPGRPPSTREVVVRPLVEPTPLVELAAVWRGGAVPAHVQAFLDVYRGSKHLLLARNGLCKSRSLPRELRAIVAKRSIAI